MITPPQITTQQKTTTQSVGISRTEREDTQTTTFSLKNIGRHNNSLTGVTNRKHNSYTTMYLLGVLPLLFIPFVMTVKFRKRCKNNE